jgi:hypothetical protein
MSVTLLTHSRLIEVMAFSDRLRQPDNLSKERESFKKHSLPTLFERLTALRPYLAAGLPLSCAIIALRKIIAIASSNSGQLD